MARVEYGGSLVVVLGVGQCPCHRQWQECGIAPLWQGDPPEYEDMRTNRRTIFE